MQKTIRKFLIHSELIFLLLLFFSLLLFTFYQNLNLSREFHLSLLANSFLQGRTDIQEPPEMYIDTVIGEDGRYYFWHEPLSAVLMIPFVLFFDQRAPQGYLNFLIVLLSLFFVNKILLTNPHTKKLIPRLWFILIYFFASSTVSLIWSPKSWYLAQHLALLFVLWSLYEWLTKKRLHILFLTILLISLTRRALLPPLLVFLSISTILSKVDSVKKISNLLILGLAAVLGSIILSFYLNLSTSSYGYFREFSKDQPNVLTGTDQIEKTEKLGSWNLANIPTNLAKYLLLGPELIKEKPDDFANLKWPYLNAKDEGISFFILSPIFLSLLFLPIIKKVELLAPLMGFFTWVLIFIPFYSSGSAQFGARYTAEVIPYLFLILTAILPPYLTLRPKVIITLSVLFNAFLLIAKVATGGFILM